LTVGAVADRADCGDDCPDSTELIIVCSWDEIWV
jgi:hypothetical protein